MSRSENLPVLPQAASCVLRLADDPDANAREIERAIEMDPAITGKLLKVANSAYYGSTRVPSLCRAIAFLGLTAVRSIVVSLAMQQLVSGRTLCPAFNKLDFWRHCLAVATTARIIGKITMPGQAEDLYGAGMLHEIGLLAMEKFAPGELQVAITTASAKGQPLAQAELETVGFTHADVGAILARRWSLSKMAEEVIAHHEQPDAPHEHQQATYAIALAESVANKLGHRHSGNPVPDEVDAGLVEAVGLDPEQVGIVCEVVEKEVLRAQETFQIAA